MKWAFLLESPDISGGTNVIFEHAIRAFENGVDITIITEGKVDQERLNWHSESKKLRWKTFNEVEDISFDVCIATWWRTVFELYRVKSQKYVYFVQSIESRFYAENEVPLKQLAESTYLLPLQIITEAKWIKEYLKEFFNKDAYLVPNGIRKDIYSMDGVTHQPREKNKLRVLVEGPVDVPFKNVMKTIDICRKSEADEIWLLTSSKINTMDNVDRVFSRVPIFETPQIYRSCDVIVKLSYIEGMFGPPLEMFHCGGTSITYDVTGHDEYILADYNGLVVKKDQDNDILNYINSLKQDRERLDLLKKNALTTAEEWPSWEKSSGKFRDVIHDIFEKGEVDDRKVLELESKFHFKWYVIGEEYKNSRIQNLKTGIKNQIKTYLKQNHPTIFNGIKKIKVKLFNSKQHL